MSDIGALLTREAPAIATQPQGQDRALRLAGVRLASGEQAIIDGVDLELGPQGCTVIMGPNGAGKSVLLRMMHGLVTPTAGQIGWGGLSQAEATRRQSLVFQKPVLLRRSVAANLDFVLRARGLDPSRRDTLLDHVGLRHRAAQPARLLSGGEAQRLAMARALATAPDVLLLDEPTASLDPASVLAIEAIMRQARDSGIRVILVTHDTGQARRMADEVVFLHRGRVAEHSPAQTFFSGARTGAARDFLDGKVVV